MTRALPAVRLPTAFAASLAIHATLAAALAVVAGGQLPQAGALASKPQGLFASVRAVQPAETSLKPAAASPRAKTGGQNWPGGWASLPKPYYHPASELTERPLPLAAIEPSFPDGAPPTGRVKIRLYIGEQGAVDGVDITEAEPAGEFEQATVQAFREARFRPGYKNGTAVRSQLTLEVRFGEPLPMPAEQRELAALALPANPNAYDAPDRIGIKTRRAR
jgi:TonB family protein